MANKAFLIGTNSLGLEYAENDLALMRQCLEKYDYGVLEVPSEAPIDKHGIQKCLDDFFDNCTKNDTVIVYFSGHADLDKGELFLIVGEKTRTDRIQFNRISESLRFCKAKNKLMVLDCCHAGSTIENRKISVSESFPILVAGERLEETRELDELKASFLTWHFHNALMSPPLDLLDKDGIIRPDSLANYLKRQGEIHNGRENADKIPIPYLNISTKSNFALADTRLIFNKIRECGTLFVECLGNDLSQIPPSNWPYTIQTALDRLRKYDRIHDYINLFEAFVHFHFVTLASQFYWCLSEEERKSPSEEIRPGLAMLRETLTCEKCCGGITWIDRSAILSKAAFHVKERLPFPELSDIFDAEQIHLSESSPTDSLWKENPLGCWQIKKAGTLWQCLSALAGLRKFVNTEIQDHKSNGDTEDILDDLCDAMGHIFRPCRNLQLAMISETQSGKERPQAGIHCCWEGTGFDCVTRKRSKNRLQTIWNRPSPKDMQILPAPDPPRSDWEWNESLIVFDPGDPYEKSVYLMPLGFRYSHNRSGESRDDGNEEKIPGLLDSVRWKGQKVSTVFQRTYSKKFREEDWQACKLPEQGAQVENLHRCIEQLCRGFTFEMPIPDTLPERPPRQFDLLHHEIADQLRENTVFRCEEIRRVMDLLTGSACRRLLLEGTSGSGKSVLLSQIYHQNRGRAVFVSNDMKVEPLEDPDFIDSALPENTASGDFEGKIGQRYSASETSKTSKSSVAIRVGMHILAVLGECMDYSPQKQELPARKIQDALRDMLSNYKNRHPEATFLVILDGLNQARDPGAMLGALPDPQPENLFVLVSSQKQERVKGPLTFYGKKRWEITNLTELQQAEAEKIIQQFWLREHKGNNAPKWEDLPQTLVRKLLDRSRYQPVFLRDWTERLKKSWHHDPERFWISAEADFDRNYKNLIPETLKRGFEEVKEDFDPPELLDALMWCFSLIPCALNRDELCRAIRILRQKGLLKDLPAVSALQISDALTKSLLGGFMRQMDTGLEQSYALAHEILGHQFCEYFLQLEQIPEFRLALVPMGAIPLPENAEEVEFDRWYQWIEEEDYEHYQLLEPISRISVCESLLARLDKNSSKYALVTSRLVQAFLSGTGEQERGFVLAPVLERAAETAHFPHRIRAEVLQSLGDILYKQQIIDIALEQYQRSLEMSEALLATSDTPGNRRDVAIAINRVGDVYRDLSQPDKALEFFQKSLEIREALLATSDTPGNRRDVAIAINRVGDVYRDLSQPDKALEFFQRSLEMSQALLAASDTPGNRRNVAIAINRVGDVYRDLSQPDKALEFFQRSLEMSEALLATSDTPGNRRDVAIAINRVGDVYRDLRQPDKALEFFQRSLEIREALLAASDTPGNRRDVAIAINRVGDVYRDLSQPDKALEFFQRSLEMSQALLAASDTPGNRRELTYTTIRVGDVYRDLNQPDKALEFFQRSLEMSQALLAASDTPGNRRDVAIAINRVGDVYRDLRQPDKALEFFRRSLEMSEALLAASDTPGNRRELTYTISRVGDVYRDLRQPDKALEFFQKSLEIREALLAASDTPGNRRDVAIAISRVGDVYLELSQPDKALEFFQRSLEMSQALLAASDTPGDRRELTYTISRVGDVYRDLNQPDKALEFFQRSYDLRKNMYHKYSTYQTLKDLLYCTETLTDLKRQLHLGDIAVRNQPWPPKLWKLFRENIWENLGEDMQEKLPEQFSCARIIREALAGNETATRPTLGFIIACCQYAQQPHLLYTFTDFRWWLEEAAAEQRQEEQLETLNRDQHQWGIRRTETVFSLKENPQVSDEITRGIEEGLTFTMSLSLEEKQEIAQKYPELSSEQIQKLLQIFREEQIKSALQTPYHQLSLKRHS